MDQPTRYETIIHIPSEYDYEIFDTDLRSEISFKKDIKEISEKIVWLPKIIFNVLTTYRTVSTNATFNIAEQNV